MAKVTFDDRDLGRPFYSPVCDKCERYSGSGVSCEAFDYIPNEIWSGKNYHTKSYKGDHGKRFKPQSHDWVRPIPKDMTWEESYAEYERKVNSLGII